MTDSFTLDAIDVHIDEGTVTETDDVEGGTVLTLREIPFVSGFGATPELARADMDVMMAKYKELLAKAETPCEFCRHPFGSHFATFDGTMAGCVGPTDPNDDEDDYCTNDCPGYDIK